MDEPSYRKAYDRSLREPEEFWAEQAQSLNWVKRPTEIRDVSFVPGDLRIRWFGDGVLNACVNCVDRHLHDGARPAIIWEGDDPAESRTISYAELHAEVCRLANGLKAIGVAKGDRVMIYLPMVPEAAVAMLACARIGAIHSVVFAGFSADALAGRIQDCKPRILITADEGMRAGRRLPMKANADQALRQCPGVKTCIVLRRTGAPTSWTEGRDLWYHALIGRQPSSCEPAPMGAEDPLFILYTSGSTGKPKGVLHTTGGYLLAASLTHKFVLDYHRDDVFWCTADIGWVTGHSYIVYGPLANGATTVMFEGVPSHPDSGRFWQVIDKHRVSIFYTSPTAIRSLIRDGELPVRRSSRASLRLLGTVGEPINPEAWLWYYNVVGQARCPIVDTTGDGARRDADGYYWITGRIDDVVNVSGHRLGTVEVESALAAHPKVVEAAVVGFPHALKGQGIYAFVTLQVDVQPGAALLEDLEQWVRKEIGPIAVPDAIQWAPNLPKTRSGKIMRRLLRQIAASQASDLGDISTLADPSVLDDLVVGHRAIVPGRNELPCTR